MLLVVGRVGRPHGITGEVVVEVRTDEPERRLVPGVVLQTDPATAGPLRVEGGRAHSGRLLVRFAGVGDRTAAERLRGALLLVDVDPHERPADDDEWYDHQLVGLDVVRADGTPVGEVAEVLHLPAHDVLVVRRGDRPDALVPFVAEFVPMVDVEAHRLVVEPPPGLLDDEPEGGH